MSNSIQDLEQEVMRCWEVVEDLKLLARVVNNGSNHTDTVKGIAEVYNLRFEKAWETYENLVHEDYEQRVKDKKLNDKAEEAWKRATGEKNGKS